MYFFIIVVSTVGSGIWHLYFFSIVECISTIKTCSTEFLWAKRMPDIMVKTSIISYASHICYSPLQFSYKATKFCYSPLQFSYKATKLLDCYHLTYRRKLRIGLGESQPNYASNFSGYYLIDGCESSRDIAELFGVVRTEARRFPTGVDCAVG